MEYDDFMRKIANDIANDARNIANIITGDVTIDNVFLDGVKDGDEIIVGALLESGANINARDKNGRTALILASMMGHFEIVKYLVKNDAKVNLKDDFGKTALDYAENDEMKQFLTTATLVSKLANMLAEK